MTVLKPMKVLAHRIYYSGRVYTLSVATIDGGRVTDISPFEKETPGTKFIPGAIQLVPEATGVRVVILKPDEEEFLMKHPLSGRF